MTSAQKLKAKRQLKVARARDGGIAYTIKGWCKMRGISVHTYYRLPESDRPPPSADLRLEQAADHLARRRRVGGTDAREGREEGEVMR
jgi:hypothetical protein